MRAGVDGVETLVRGQDRGGEAPGGSRSLREPRATAVRVM